MKHLFKLTLLLILVSTGIILYRIFALGYTLDLVTPADCYRVDLNISLTGYGSSVKVKTTLPFENERQWVNLSSLRTSGFDHEIVSDEEGNTFGVFREEKVKARRDIGYTFEVSTRSRKYFLPKIITKPSSYPESLSLYLHPTEKIQSNSIPISRGLNELVSEEDTGNVYEVMSRLYKYVNDRVEYVKYKGSMDAVTTYKSGKADCDGKARLLVAFLRASGIPARIVGGLILNPGTKKSTHNWVEAWVNSFWIPMDPVNHYFGELPANYLVFYYGDKSLFTRTRHIDFDYNFEIKKLRTKETENVLGGGILSTFGMWKILSGSHVPMENLTMILMMPVGALVLAIFRNMIGVRTLGTFLPVLLALSFRETGIIIGLILFAVIIVIGWSVRVALDKMKLQGVPRMNIMMITVITSLFSLTVLGSNLGFHKLAGAGLFPVVVLSMSVERFFATENVDGILSALKVALATIATISLCYLAMTWSVLQNLMLLFPELLLVFVAFNILIGRWTGIRFSEYIRFREFIFRKAD